MLIHSAVCVATCFVDFVSRAPCTASIHWKSVRRITAGTSSQYESGHHRACMCGSPQNVHASCRCPSACCKKTKLHEWMTDLTPPLAVLPAGPEACGQRSGWRPTAGVRSPGTRCRAPPASPGWQPARTQSLPTPRGPPSPPAKMCTLCIGELATSTLCTHHHSCALHKELQNCFRTLSSQRLKFVRIRELSLMRARSQSCNMNGATEVCKGAHHGMLSRLRKLMLRNPSSFRDRGSPGSMGRASRPDSPPHAQ